MSELKKILVVEDELSNAFLLKKVLSKTGFIVVTANSGFDAFKWMKNERFDALLTDWMMPKMDGIELIKQTREKIKPNPFIMVITALVSDAARNYAIESGADDFIAKPIDIEELVARVKEGIEKYRQEAPDKTHIIRQSELSIVPEFAAVAIAASSGGPSAIIEIFKNMPLTVTSAFYIIQHGPPWMVETFVSRLQQVTMLKVELALRGTKSRPGCIYIAPGDNHLKIEEGTLNLILEDGPKENFVRPSADPLFRSVSEAFGKYCIGVVLTGLGRDGTLGAEYIASVDGTVFVQDPLTATSPSMPMNIIQSGIPHIVLPLDKMAEAISKGISKLDEELKLQKNIIVA